MELARTTARSVMRTCTWTTIRLAMRGGTLSFIALSEAARIAREHDAELDEDGATRAEWDEPPHRSFLGRLLRR